MTESPPQAPPPSSPPPPGPGWNTEHLTDYRGLRRSRSDRKIAGVAGGLGRHLNIDPLIVRVLLVVLVIFGGAGLLLYAVMWLLVPDEGTERSVIGTSDAARNALLIGAAVVAGLIAVGDSWDGAGLAWPLIVLAFVLVAVLLGRDRSGPRSPGAAPPPPYTPGGNPPATGQPPAAYGPAWQPPAPDPRRTGPLLFGSTLALLLLALGVLGLYDTSGGSVDDAAYAALAVAVIGTMLVVGAFVGRAGGLILLGLVAALALAGAAIGEPSYDGDRDQVIRPVLPAELENDYDVPAGRIVVDLTRLDSADLGGRDLQVAANAGEILVIVPDGLRVDVDADIEFGGAIETPGGDDEGWGASVTSSFGDEDAEELTLDLDLKFGHIEVRQS